MTLLYIWGLASQSLEGGDAPDLFAFEELLPVIPIDNMKRKWRRTISRPTKKQGDPNE